jgi:hypothetical protein
MLATRTGRHRPLSVHLTESEAAELAIEAEIAASLSDDVPELERLGTKLGLLLGNPGRTRA